MRIIFLFQERREDCTGLQSPGRFGAAFGTCVERRPINDSDRILKNCERARERENKKKKTECLSSCICVREGKLENSMLF